MRFKELIEGNNWLSISLTLIKLYPDQQKSMEGYKNVFETLQIIKPEDSDIEIVLQYYKDEQEEEGYIAVSGKKTNRNTESKTVGIEFVPWKEWLGMSVNVNTLKDFNELEIICHCLYEMTFYGYDEKEIQKTLSQIEASAEEIENMTEEERKKNLKSLDDLLKELNGDESI